MDAIAARAQKAVSSVAAMARQRGIHLSLQGVPMTTSPIHGSHDFDFLLGDWRVRHSRLKERLAGGAEWTAFEGTTSVRPILGGLGNFDENVIGLPDGDYEACTLRLFDPRTGDWALRWIDARDPKLDPPVVGRFDRGVGHFYGDDVHDGQRIGVRFIWSDITASSCRWTQAFSSDAGGTWETNWTMDFARVEGAGNGTSL